MYLAYSNGVRGMGEPPRFAVYKSRDVTPSPEIDKLAYHNTPFCAGLKGDSLLRNVWQ